MIHPVSEDQFDYKSSEPEAVANWCYRQSVRMSGLLALAALLALLSGGWCQEKTFLQRAGSAFTSRPYRSMLSVANGERFGNWTWPEMCPDTFFAVGFSVRVKMATPSRFTCGIVSIKPEVKRQRLLQLIRAFSLREKKPKTAPLEVQKYWTGR